MIFICLSKAGSIRRFDDLSTVRERTAGVRQRTARVGDVAQPTRPLTESDGIISATDRSCRLEEIEAVGLAFTK